MLPGRRRLQQGVRDGPGTTPGRRAAPATQTDAPAELPTYMPQACSLDADAIAALRSLNQNLRTGKLDGHVRESLAFLTSGTVALSGTLNLSRSQLDNISAKKEAERARFEKEVVKLEDVTRELTTGAEEAVRGLVDLRGELEDEREALAAVLEAAHARLREREWERAERRRVAMEHRAANGGGEDGEDEAEMFEDVEEEGEVEAVSGLVEAARETKAARYKDMVPYQRYALNNDYAGFKRQWHSALHGEDAVLPDTKRWFSQDGQPVLHFGRSRDGEDGGADSADTLDGDTDLIVEREVISTRCPLSLREMVEPYANSRCRHVFEKAAILEFLSGQTRVTCPQSGCNMTFTRDDFHIDHTMLARIRRKKNRRSTGGDGDGEDDDDDDDDDGEEEEEEEARGEGEEEGSDGDEEAEEETPVKSEAPAPRSARARRSVKRERME